MRKIFNVSKNYIHRVIFFGFLSFYCFNVAAQEIDTNVPMGWAVVPGNGVESTIGGGNGNTVVANNASQLASYAGSSQPLIIRVEGSITGTGSINIASNKTIIGVGSNATLTNAQLNMSDVSNIIIRNLTITGAVDGIATRRTTHVWIDHCDVSNCGDGLIDITRQSDFHTVSWTRLSNHHKTMLINSGTGQPEDAGTLNTTLHHNWWDGSDTRNPRVGYAKVHVFNCLYNNNDYCIGLHSECQVFIEKNYFNNTNDPILHMYTTYPTSPIYGFCESVNNIFTNISGENGNDGISFRVDDYYMYDFLIDEAADVPAIVPAGVGPAAEFEELGLMPVPGQGAVRIGTNPTLKWTKGQSATSYFVSFGATFPPPYVDTVEVQTYNPGSLEEGTIYYWSVDQVTPTDTIRGKVWKFRIEGTVPGRPYVVITSPTDGASFPALSDITIETEAWDSNGTINNVEFFEGPRSLGVDDSTPYTLTWNAVTDGYYMLKAKVTDNEGNMYASDIVTIMVGDGGLPQGPAGYVFCSNENETCTFTGTVNVAYGANGKFNYKYNVTGSIECSNDVFGDPISGTAKACYTQEVGTPFVDITSPVSGTKFPPPADIQFDVDATDNDGTVDSVQFHQKDTYIGVSTESPFSFTWNTVPEGNYSVTATAFDNDGKFFTSQAVTIIVEDVSAILKPGLANAIIYPNPVSEKLVINLKDNSNKNTSVSIYNSIGSMMLQQDFSGQTHILDLEFLSEGIYLLNLKNMNGNIFLKVIKN